MIVEFRDVAALVGAVVGAGGHDAAHALAAGVDVDDHVLHPPRLHGGAAVVGDLVERRHGGAAQRSGLIDGNFIDRVVAEHEKAMLGGSGRRTIPFYRLKGLPEF